MNNDNVNLGKEIYSVILYTTPGGVSFTSAVCKLQRPVIFLTHENLNNCK